MEKREAFLPVETSDPVMYRTEEFSGEGYRDPAEVLAFETRKLGNVDAVDYMIGHYLDPSSKLYERALEIKEAVLSDVPDETDPDEVLDFYGACLREIEKRTGKKVTWCLWLASLDAVVGCYALSGAEHLHPDAYRTEGAVVLDDLGYDGMLLGFEAPQEPIN